MTLSKPLGCRRFYNGFSGQERQAASRKTRRALMSGQLAPPCTCSMCGALARQGTQLSFHVEDYRRPLAVYPVCGRCHFLLHTRFREPHRWLRHLDRIGEGWFRLLSLDPESRTRPFDETYPDGLPLPS